MALGMLNEFQYRSMHFSRWNQHAVATCKWLRSAQNFASALFELGLCFAFVHQHF